MNIGFTSFIAGQRAAWSRARPQCLLLRDGLGIRQLYPPVSGDVQAAIEQEHHRRVASSRGVSFLLAAGSTENAPPAWCAGGAVRAGESDRLCQWLTEP